MKIDDWFQTLLPLPFVLAPIPEAGLDREVLLNLLDEAYAFLEDPQTQLETHGRSIRP